MATLIPTRKEWLQQPGEKFLSYMDRMDKVLDTLKRVKKDESFVGRTLSFGVADGSAIYVIKKEKPLQLEHLPYGDAYRVSAAHIRGLRLADVQREADFAAMWAKK